MCTIAMNSTMKICNIYPIANQELYQQEEYIMILAHLVKKGLYDPKFFNGRGAHIIMDNGLFEKAQVSTNLQDCINIAKSSGLEVSELVVPDAINDTEKTMELFEQNWETIKNNPQYTYMFVAQGRNEEEVAKAIDFINGYLVNSINNNTDMPKIVVGISKLTPMDRASKKAIEIYKKCLYPIHFLGIKESFQELNDVCKIIRSCDSSQLAYIAKNEDAAPANVWLYKRIKDSNHIDIDLEFDKLDSGYLKRLKELAGLN